MKRITLTVVVASTVVLGAQAAAQQGHEHSAMHGHNTEPAAIEDTRTLVHFPEPLRSHTLANMRDHLLALQEIQEAMAADEFEKAGEIAEQRLGMTSLKLHGGGEKAKYMPEGMQAIGSEMHRSASRFAVAASDAAVTGDIRPALGALARVTKQCVACHTSYRVQ